MVANIFFVTVFDETSRASRFLQSRALTNVPSSLLKLPEDSVNVSTLGESVDVHDFNKYSTTRIDS